MDVSLFCDGTNLRFADCELAATWLGEDSWDYYAGEDLAKGFEEDSFFGDVVVFLVGGEGVDVGGTARVKVTAHVHVSFSYDFGGTEPFDHRCGVAEEAIIVP